MKISYFFLFLLLICSALVTPSSLYASGECNSVYGGGQFCTTGKLSLQTSILNPQNKTFVSSLTNWAFSSNDTVDFKITLHNIGDEKVDNIVLKDIFPSYTSFQSGQGKLNNTKTEIIFPTTELNAHQSVTYDVNLKVLPSNQLRFNDPVSCDLFNTTQAMAKDQKEEQRVQLCLQKQISTTKSGMPIYNTNGVITKTPPTGPEMIPLLGLIPTGVLGLLLRKKA